MAPSPGSQSDSPPPRDPRDRRSRGGNHHRRTSSTAELLQSSGRDTLDAGPNTYEEPTRRRRDERRRQRREEYYTSRERDGRPEQETDWEEGYRHERRRRRHEDESRRRRSAHNGNVVDSETSKTTSSGSNALSADSLAKLNRLNDRLSDGEVDKKRVKARGTKREQPSAFDHGYEERIRRRERARELEREREREKERQRERERERELERERQWERERERERQREQARDKDRDRDREGRREARREEQYHRRRRHSQDHNHYRENDEDIRVKDKRRVVSGPLLEEGIKYREREKNYFFDSPPPPPRRGNAFTSDPSSDGGVKRKWWRRKLTWIVLAITVIVLIIAIAVGVSVSKKHDDPPAASTTSQPANSNLNGISESSIPPSAQGTYLDPFTWYDTTDFNVTYTNVTVGGLPIMGLNSTWNDNTRANSNVPPLTAAWQYGTVPVRGVNLGGWLSIEPFITPSFFNAFSSNAGVVDEWTLCQALGPESAAKQIEEHYSSFVNEQTFADIQAAGFDHVRIPYSYWAVTTYPGDPYVPKISWRYLLRALEYARKYGLRINLDLHGLPGSQNGWNHSGHQGVIGWLNGTDGDLNAQRSLDIHTQLSSFFAQPRYKNLITMYGLVNEPRMVLLDTNAVLNWSSSAISIIRASGMPNETVVVIGDGFLGLPNWQDKLPSESRSNVLLDVHQYVIFNSEQISLNHTSKISFACDGWTQQTQQSMNPQTGFGNFMCGEWSQADTDCVTYLNNVGWGTRWEGTLNTGNASTSVLSPDCPTGATGNIPPCDCTPANSDPSGYTAEYKTWLQMFAEAQMHSYEFGWGWFYWTWKTESATQWSYEAGMAAGILPTNVQTRDFNCASGSIPDFAAAGLSETY